MDGYDEIDAEEVNLGDQMIENEELNGEDDDESDDEVNVLHMGHID